MSRSRPIATRAASFVALLALACADSGPSTPAPSPGGPLGGSASRDGIDYRADVAVMESFPVQLAGHVTITNTTDAERTVTFPDGCVALLRAYRPEGGEPVWDQAEEFGCTMALVPMTLAPGASREVGTPTASGYDVLGEDLPDGTYRIAVYLRPDGREIEIDTGTVELAIPRR